MKLLRLLPIALLATIAAALPAPASAAEISRQERVTGRFPVDMAGGYRRGARIPKGFALLRRRIALEKGEKGIRTGFRCPRRSQRIRTLGANDPSELGFRVPTNQIPYTTRRSVTVELFRSPRVGSSTAHGDLYALCGRRR